MTADLADDSFGPLVIVTGMSGAGRSTAAKELEDLGYFVIDNLPSPFLPEVVGRLNDSLGRTHPIAVVADVRSREFLGALAGLLGEGVAGRTPQVVYLDATDDVLVRRQEAVRRPHPLQGNDRLLDGLERERIALGELRGFADLVIDTSNLNVHQLTARIADAFGSSEATKVRIRVISFGFKYGIPIDADFVADMRFLPNPYWVPELREGTGKDQPVADYVYAAPGAQDFLSGYVPVLTGVVPGYLREGKRHMRVAIGCTGGKHRSVAMTEEVVRRLAAQGFDAVATHRDLGKE